MVLSPSAEPGAVWEYLGRKHLLQGSLSSLYQNANRDWSQSESGHSSSTTTYSSKCSIPTCLRMEENSWNNRKTPSLTHWVALACCPSPTPRTVPRASPQNPAWLCGQTKPLHTRPAEEHHWMTHCPWPKGTWTDKWTINQVPGTPRRSFQLSSRETLKDRWIGAKRKSTHCHSWLNTPSNFTFQTLLCKARSS